MPIAIPPSRVFAPASYDLIVASFVIHATSKLEQTMRYVRSRLRPGGYVVLGESTNQNWAHDGFVFGTLPGWWAGIPEGRNLSPCVSADRWDEVLRNTGFSGIDAIMPEPFNNTYATGVFVSPAVDEQVSFLREPLLADLPRYLATHRHCKPALPAVDQQPHAFVATAAATAATRVVLFTGATVPLAGPSLTVSSRRSRLPWLGEEGVLDGGVGEPLARDALEKGYAASKWVATVAENIAGGKKRIYFPRFARGSE